MLHEVEITFDLPDGHVVGNRAVLAWEGQHGSGTVDHTAPLSQLGHAVFGTSRPELGKGRSGYKEQSKTGRAVSERVGKGKRPKGKGPKGRSRARLRVSARVPPIFGRRSFAARIYDAQGNYSATPPVVAEMTISAVPPRPLPARLDSYDQGSDVVTILAPQRMR